MRLFEKISQRTYKELEFLPKREVYPLDSFRTKCFYAIQLLGIVEDQTSDRKIKIEARKNFIINCVTATEVYFKDIVKILSVSPEVKESSDKIKELLKEKIRLWEAYVLFVKKKFRLGDVINSIFSFQNLEEIDYVMSKILNIKFLNLIENYKADLDEGDREYYGVNSICLKTDLPKWRKYLAEVFRLRNDFIHHISFRDRIGLNRLGILWENLDAFITVVDDFISQYIPGE